MSKDVDEPRDEAESVSASVKLAFSVAHKEASAATVTHRQLQSSFPTFTVLHHHSPIAAAPHDVMFAGRKCGQVVSWKMPASRTGSFLEHTVLGSHKGGVTAMCSVIVPHGGGVLLLTGSCDYHVKVWDPFGSEMPGLGRCIQTIPAHAATVTSMASHCDVVITTSVDKTLKLWRFDADREKLCFPWLVVAQVCVLDSWIMSVWAAPTKQADGCQGEICTVDSHGEIVLFRSVAASSSMDAFDEVHVERLEVLRSVTAERAQTVNRILVISSLNQFVTLGFENYAVVRDLLSLSILVKIPSPDNVRFVDVAWDGFLEDLLFLAVDGKAHLWSTRRNLFVTSFFAGYAVSAVRYLSSTTTRSSYWIAHRDSIDCVQIDRTRAFVRHLGHVGRVIGLLPKQCDFDTVTTDDDFEIASASVDNTICFWNSNIHCVKVKREKVSEISAFCMLTSVPWIVTGHDNGGLKCWCLDKDKAFRFAAHDNTVTVVGEGQHRVIKGSVEPSPHLFTVSYDGCLAVWEMPMEGNRAKCEARVRASRSELISAAYDPLNYCYIVGSNDGDILIFSIDELRPVRTLTTKPTTQTPFSGQLAITSFALDGNYLYSGGEDGKLRMWNTLSGDLLQTFSFSGDAADFGDIQHMIVMPENGDVVLASRSGLLVQVDPSGSRSQRFIKLDKEVTCLLLRRGQGKLLLGLDDGSLMTVHLAILEDVTCAESRAATPDHENDNRGPIHVDND